MIHGIPAQAVRHDVAMIREALALVQMMQRRNFVLAKVAPFACEIAQVPELLRNHPNNLGTLA